jgi:hypothetical protein
MACEMEELRDLLPYRQDNTSPVGECLREP